MAAGQHNRYIQGTQHIKVSQCHCPLSSIITFYFVTAQPLRQLSYVAVIVSYEAINFNSVEEANAPGTKGLCTLFIWLLKQELKEEKLVYCALYARDVIGHLVLTIM